MLALLLAALVLVPTGPARASGRVDSWVRARIEEALAGGRTDFVELSSDLPAAVYVVSGWSLTSVGPGEAIKSGTQYPVAIRLRVEQVIRSELVAGQGVRLVRELEGSDHELDLFVIEDARGLRWSEGVPVPYVKAGRESAWFPAAK